MATILTNKFKVRNAKALMELFRTNHVYMFIGRNRAWADEASPPTPSNLTALSDELDVWNDIIVLKKIYIRDVSLVIPRNDYSTSDSYTEYEHDKLVQPVVNGRKVYFSDENDGFSVLREFGIVEDLQEETAENITSHVPSYIKGKGFEIIPHDDFMFIISL